MPRGYTMKKQYTVSEQGDQMRAEAREADGTFLEQGFGATDTLATAALAGDLVARVPQQSTKSAQEKMLKHALYTLQAWAQRLAKEATDD